MDMRFQKLKAVLSWMMSFTLFALMLLLFVNVILRYFFSYAISWAEEITSEGLVLIVFLGLPILSLQGKHIKIDLLNQFISKEANSVLALIAKLLEIIVSFSLFLAGSYMVFKVYPIQEKLIASGVPVWILFAVLPVMFLVTLIVLCIDTMSHSAEKKV